jgi:hypothetical protein
MQRMRFLAEDEAERRQSDLLFTKSFLSFLLPILMLALYLFLPFYVGDTGRKGAQQDSNTSVEGGMSASSEGEQHAPASP